MERPERLAARWAAKEAVAKAIGTGFRGLRPRQIEIVHHPWGEPTVDQLSATDPWPDGAGRMAVVPVAGPRRRRRGGGRAGGRRGGGFRKWRGSRSRGTTS
jgi:hypothetical protein